jgi:hypothetical protein
LTLQTPSVDLGIGRETEGGVAQMNRLWHWLVRLPFRFLWLHFFCHHVSVFDYTVA